MSIENQTPEAMAKEPVNEKLTLEEKLATIYESTPVSTGEETVDNAEVNLQSEELDDTQDETPVSDDVDDSETIKAKDDSDDDSEELQADESDDTETTEETSEETEEKLEPIQWEALEGLGIDMGDGELWNASKLQNRIAELKAASTKSREASDELKKAQSIREEAEADAVLTKEKMQLSAVSEDLQHVNFAIKHLEKQKYEAHQAGNKDLFNSTSYELEGMQEHKAKVEKKAIDKVTQIRTAQLKAATDKIANTEYSYLLNDKDPRGVAWKEFVDKTYGPDKMVDILLSPETTIAVEESRLYRENKARAKTKGIIKKNSDRTAKPGGQNVNRKAKADKAKADQIAAQRNKIFKGKATSEEKDAFRQQSESNLENKFSKYYSN